MNISGESAGARWSFRVGSGLAAFALSASLIACGSATTSTAPSEAASAPSTAAASVPATAAASTPASAPASAASADATGKVAFLLPDNTTPRWTSQDGPSFEKWMKQLAPNVQVITNVANNDPQQQLSQAQAAIAQGAKVLVVVAVDGTQAAKIVETASAANVPVIAYTRQIQSPNVKYMIGDDPGEIGKALGTWTMANTKDGDTIAVIAGSTTDSFAHLERDGWMSVLKPAFDSNARKLVGDVWTPGWDPVKAHGLMDAILTSSQNNIQAVLAANDSTAEGSIASLKTHGLAGKIPVTGIDATLSADKLILQGLQSMSVWRSVDDEAKYTSEIVVDLLTGTAPPSDFFTSKVSLGGADVPMKAVPSIVIDKTNMQTLIDAGAISKADLCNGIPAGTGPCN